MTRHNQSETLGGSMATRGRRQVRVSLYNVLLTRREVTQKAIRQKKGILYDLF